MLKPNVRLYLIAGCLLLVFCAFRTEFEREHEKTCMSESLPVTAETVFRWTEHVCVVGAVNRDLPFRFAVDDDEIGFPENYALLDSVVQYMNAMPSVEIEVGQHLGGYTRLRRSQEFHLSHLRAQSIVAALVERGINSRRLTAVGYGTSVPIVSRDSMATMSRSERERGHESNRRTEFKILRCE